MLKEIQSNAFVSHGIIRPKITFNRGLNVVNGSESGTNSIGKSTFLMALDFCFGGDDYIDKLKTVVRNVGDHEIYFAFEFNGKISYFCRSTSNPDIVVICDKNYNKKDESWSQSEFLRWLNISYSNPTSLTFRAMVSLYLRIYNRENLNEQLPLRSFNNQTEGQSIENLLRLYDLFGPISEASKEAKEAGEKKSAFTDAQKYEYIPKINKTKYEENKKRINELEKEKRELAKKSEKGLLDLNSTQADLISDLRAQLSTFKRQRRKYYTKLDILKKDKSDNRETISKDFEELKVFFPELNIQKLYEVEEFHKKISSIMMSQVKESEKKTWNLINLLNDQINDLENRISEISQVKNVSTVTLEKYSEIDKTIEKLKLENEKYEKLDELSADCKTKDKKLTEDTMVQTGILENKLNTQMRIVNTYIFPDGDNTPYFHVKTPKRYEFYTPDDDGTGTNYKGLIVMDISTLQLTALPILIHDSVLLKQISNESIEKIFEIYKSTNKQIFVSIDKDKSYTPHTVEIIKECEVLRISSGGNELFGFTFGKKGATQ